MVCRWASSPFRYPAGTSSRDRTGTGKAAPSPLLTAGAGPDSARRPIGCDPPRRSCPDRARRRRHGSPGGRVRAQGHAAGVRVAAAAATLSTRSRAITAQYDEHAAQRLFTPALDCVAGPRNPKPQHEPLGLDAALQTLARTCRGPRPPRTASWRRSPRRSPPVRGTRPPSHCHSPDRARPRKIGPVREEARAGERVTDAGQGRRRYECGPGGHPARPAAGLAPVGVVVRSLGRARPADLRTFRGPARRGRHRPRSGARRSRPWPGPRGARGPRRRVSAVRRCAFRGPVRAARPA
ncbi:hypothetical protein GA0115251_116727 [Streptomyces sp. TverLS-915]|nr:hypothetical protein GA0115251_116727 [Streptomyces sp. TverLS-915]